MVIVIRPSADDPCRQSATFHNSVNIVEQFYFIVPSFCLFHGRLACDIGMTCQWCGQVCPVFRTALLCRGASAIVPAKDGRR